MVVSRHGIDTLNPLPCSYVTFPGYIYILAQNCLITAPLIDVRDILCDEATTIWNEPAPKFVTRQLIKWEGKSCVIESLIDARALTLSLQVV